MYTYKYLQKHNVHQNKYITYIKYAYILGTSYNRIHTLSLSLSLYIYIYIYGALGPPWEAPRAPPGPSGIPWDPWGPMGPWGGAAALCRCGASFSFKCFVCMLRACSFFAYVLRMCYIYCVFLVCVYIYYVSFNMWCCVCLCILYMHCIVYLFWIYIYIYIFFLFMNFALSMYVPYRLCTLHDFHTYIYIAR